MRAGFGVAVLLSVCTRHGLAGRRLLVLSLLGWRFSHPDLVRGMSGEASIGDAVAMLDLAAVPWKATRHEGVFIHFFHAGSGGGPATVMIRMEPGAAYPGHRHVGVEELLILQGGYQDELGHHAQGEYVRYERGSIHHPRCPRDAREACVFFAVAHEGIAPVAQPGTE